MRIFLTGATGGLGRNAAAGLRARGHDLLCSGRNPAILSELARDGFETVRCDLSRDELAPLLRGIQAIVHAAAFSSPWGTPAEFQRHNLDATVRLAQAAVRAGVPRFVHVSTPSILHRDRDQEDLRESDPPPPPVNEYARTKALAEMALLGFSGSIEVVGIRPRALYGPWDQALFPRLARANDSKGIPLLRGGRALVDLTSMENAVQALALCLEAPPSALGRFYHITDGAPLPLKTAIEEAFQALGVAVRWKRLPLPLVQAVAGAMELAARLGSGKEPLLTRYGVAVLSRTQTLCIDAAREHLGYAPVATWKESLETYARWWRVHGPG